MQLVGANPSTQVVGLDELPGRSHYLVGNDPEKWRTYVPTYAKVKYEEVYPGVDLIYYGNQRQLEYDFVVAPGADPTVITLAFSGVSSLEMDSVGDLVLRADNEEIRLHKPYVYQEVHGVRQPISASYKRLGSEPKVGFQIAAYDASKPLIIDPILNYFTFLQGNKSDIGNSISLDIAGNIYLTGFTGSTDFPVVNPLQSSPGGGPLGDAFVAKLNSTGTAIVYTTYLGGNGVDMGQGIAVDTSGNAYVTGITHSTNLPATGGVFDPSCGTDGLCNGVGSINFSDAFVAKLNATGNTLLYLTYLGGSKNDEGFGVAVDGFGNAYITGGTESLDFFGINGLQTFNAGVQDAFVVKLNLGGTAPIYATYLGGSGLDSGHGIAIDLSGNAYITGRTGSLNFPTRNPFQATLGSVPLIADDAFLVKLNTFGNNLLYATYLGGSNTDGGFGVAVDKVGYAYVTGTTSSTNFPVANSFQSLSGGAQDAFVAKIDPSQAGAASLLYSTYLGGKATDEGFGIAVDSFGNAYVAGSTGSTNFPTLNPFQASNSGGFDAFVARLDPVGILLYSTYLGGSGDDKAFDIAVDTSVNAYVTGSLGMDTLISRVTPRADLSVIKTAFPNPVLAGQVLTYTLMVTNNGPDVVTGVTVTDTLPSGVTFVSVTASQGTGCTQSGEKVTCNLGSLARDASAIVTIKVLAPLTITTLTNTTAISGVEADTNISDNNVAQNAGVIAADLSITQTDAPDPIFEGQNVTYTLAVVNTGPANATGVTVDDILPGGATFLSANASQGGNCAVAGNTVTCPLGTLAGGASASITILITAPLGAGVITNTANVTLAEPDLNGSNNTSMETTTLNPLPTPTPTPEPILIAWGVNKDVPVPEDYDGDHQADIAVWRAGNGTFGGQGNWFLLLNPPVIQPWGIRGDQPIPEDYDGDGKADVAVFRPSSGTWFILKSTGIISTQKFGTSLDSPVPEDYDGDAIADLAVFRSSIGLWIIEPSGGGNLNQISWGLPGDIPVPADYDGDEKADVTVWRPKEGNWYINLSTGGFDVRQLGLPILVNDRPVSADYDGDGKTDIAIWRPGDGTWHFTLSSVGSLFSRQWGLPGDIPVPADYNGDKKADLAVWRPSDGIWYITFDK
jgi:uncharacterized repeat protein (TIGR01451 family)